MNLADLHKPFPPNEIEWRVGSTNSDKTRGLALAYLTARHVMERLDSVCGAANWQDRYEFHGGRTVCYLSIKIGDEWITKADGAGDSDVEAEKGAISDALKRAAVKWGIGRYLYDLGQTWVSIEAAGRSFKIAREEYGRLEQMLANRFGMDGEVKPAPAAMPKISAYRAKQFFNFEAIVAEIDGASERGLQELEKTFAGDMSFLPTNWLDRLRERVASRRKVLAGDEYQEPSGPGAEMDRAYRDTIGERA